MACRAMLLLAACLLVMAQHAHTQPSIPRLPNELAKRLRDLNDTRTALAQPDVAFAAFLVTHSKNWSDAERPRRFTLYRQALDAAIRSHAQYEAGNRTTWLKITPFADLTPEKFRAAPIRGLIPSTNATQPSITRRELLQASSLPASVDWRTTSFGSAVTPVQNQGQCNDCWAFASAAAVETSAAIRFQTPAVELSEQQVVNCAPTSGGCSTGNTLTGAMSYYVGPGVTTAANFPYTSGSGAYTANAGCNNLQQPLTNISGFTMINPGRPEQLQGAVSTTAVMVGICSETIQLYAGGLLTSNGNDEFATCAGCSAIDHAVTIIGYDTTPSGAGAYGADTQNYWIVKNQWGTGWGDSGYAYFAMSGGTDGGRGNLYGPCSILAEPIAVPPSAVSVSAAIPQPPAPPGSSTRSSNTPPPAPPLAAGGLPRFSATLYLLVCAVVAAAAMAV